jgi:hypothetical protein
MTEQLQDWTESTIRDCMDALDTDDLDYEALVAWCESQNIDCPTEQEFIECSLD